MFQYHVTDEPTAVIEQSVLTNFHNHAIGSLPNEASAFLIGRHDKNYYIDSLLRMSNAEPSPASFTMDNQEVFEAYKKTAELNQTIVGVIHSHPWWPARPSARDVGYMLFNPGVWIIESLNYGQVKAFAFIGQHQTEENIREIPLEIIVADKK